MPPRASPHTPVVFPEWNPIVDRGFPGAKRQGEKVVAYHMEFPTPNGDKFAASKPARIVSFEPFQRIDLYASKDNNCIKVQFDNDNSIKIVNAKYVWPRPEEYVINTASGGASSSKKTQGKDDADMQDSRVIALHKTNAIAQQHIVALNKQAKKLSERIKSLEQKNLLLHGELKASKQNPLQATPAVISRKKMQEKFAASQEKLALANATLDHERKINFNLLKRTLECETGACHAQNQLQDIQDEMELQDMQQDEMEEQ